VPNHLQEIAVPAAKAEQVAAHRIPQKHLLHLQGQERKAFPHVIALLALRPARQKND
jgi:hypothetical protein